MCKISLLSVYCGIQKIKTRATSRCDRQNTINAFARVVFSIFILSIFSIILTLKVSLINTVMQNTIFYYQTTRLSRVFAKLPLGWAHDEINRCTIKSWNKSVWNLYTDAIGKSWINKKVIKKQHGAFIVWFSIIM